MEHSTNSDYFIPAPQTMLDVSIFLFACAMSSEEAQVLYFNIKKYYFNIKIYLENQTPDLKTVTFKDEGKSQIFNLKN